MRVGNAMFRPERRQAPKTPWFDGAMFSVCEGSSVVWFFLGGVIRLDFRDASSDAKTACAAGTVQVQFAETRRCSPRFVGELERGVESPAMDGIIPM